MTPAATTPAAELAARTRRHINRRLLPFLFVLYVVAFLDRVNVSYAGLEMTRELHFSNTVFGFGSGIFFLGYVLLEIPGTILVEVWSARKWIARIMISWGIVAALTGLVTTAPQFYSARFLLGVAEAGFFPGVIVYLTHWYRAEDRARAIAAFMSAIPLSQVLGAPLSALLLNVHWFGYSGWRWLLILEGVPAVALGVVTLFYLTDRPHQAAWLPEDERAWLERELDAERRAKAAAAPVRLWRALTHRNVLLLTGAYFCTAVLQYGFGLFLPKMIQRLSGLGPAAVALISAIPFLASWPAMVFMGWSSDRTGERRWHTAAPCFVVAAAFAAWLFAPATAVAGVALFSLAMMGINARLPGFWSLPTAFLAGTAAAASIGAINCIGNIGGFVGPYLVGKLTDVTGDYRSAVVGLIVFATVAGVLILSIKRPANAPSSRS